MGVQESRLTMYRDGNPRLHPLIHFGQFITTGVTGDMYGILFTCRHDLNAAIGEQVVECLDGLLIAGNDPRREENGITRLQRHLGMLIIGNPPKRRTRLTLASRTKKKHLFSWQVANISIVDQWRHILEIASLPGGSD